VFARQPAGGVPVVVATQSRYLLSDKKWAAVANLSKKFYTLGILEVLGALQEAWDCTAAYPPEMPYSDSEPDDNGRVFETLDEFLTGKKAEGTKSVAAVSKDAGQVGAAIFASLVRAILSLPPGIEFMGDPVEQMLAHLAAVCDNQPTALARDVGACTAADREIVVQMILVHRIKKAYNTTHRIPCHYGKFGDQMLKQLKDTPAASRLGNWGAQLSDIYIDFFRHIGEVFAGHLWEHKQTFTTAFVLGTIRSLPKTTQRPLPQGAITALAPCAK